MVFFQLTFLNYKYLLYFKYKTDLDSEGCDFSALKRSCRLLDMDLKRHAVFDKCLQLDSRSIHAIYLFTNKF